MNRRTFLCGLTLGTLAAPLAAEAQQAGKVLRIGYLSGLSAEADVPFAKEFRRGLQALDRIEGRHLVIEYRHAEGRTERLSTLLNDLISLQPDVIVTSLSTPQALAAKKATSTIPIVFVTGGDPIEYGIVSNLARPEGNITGAGGTLTIIQKRVELMREVFPRASGIGFLSVPGNPIHQSNLKATQVAAQRLGLKLYAYEVRSSAELDNAFPATKKARLEALLVLGDDMFIAERSRLANLAVRERIATMCAGPIYVKAGCFMSFSVDILDLHRRAAAHVDKILRGMTPRDIPVEQATKFELVINLKTAKALGLTIPQTILLRADHVIE